MDVSNIANIEGMAISMLLAIVAYFLRDFAKRLESMELRQSQNALNIESIRKEIEQLHEARKAMDGRMMAHDAKEEDLYRQLPSVIASALDPISRRLERIEDRLMAGK